MKHIRPFNVVASLPEELSGLRTLAYNLWWSWNAEALELFMRLDRELWNEVSHNPVLLLGKIDQRRLQELKTDSGFLAHLRRVLNKLDHYMAEPAWFQRVHGNSRPADVGYFSLEFGIHESLPIYSGGLGVLAGDHLKSASDLGVPLVGVGLLYRRGYFHQRLNADGWQQEVYPDNDFYNMPVTLLRNADGQPTKIQVELPGRAVQAQIWLAQVGRVPLYLLDTNLESNPPADREITASLYGGDNDMRIRQEILLGVGGVRALAALNIKPRTCHMNEGHSAFLGLERARMLMRENGVSFTEVREAVAAGTVFTTHTPVPAGIDVFHPDMVEHYFGVFRRELGLERQDLLAIGRHNPADQNEGFNMAVLAIRLSAKRNGVSKLHGEVSRAMWQRLWPELPEQEVPIRSVTNGIHTDSWLATDMAFLFDSYLGSGWHEEPTDEHVWQSMNSIPDAELWRTHERQRERLVTFARRRLHEQLQRRGASPAELAVADEVLDPHVLTICFARRFATYKRGTLLLRDPDRLRRLVNNPERPVQIIFAGKAHPKDVPGKELIRELIHFMRQPEFRGRLVFMEDYDVNIAHYMVQGSDVWLNTPRRPLEASGTSGMKATVNGCINLSVLDGWWCEAARPDNGWSIGSGEVYEDEKFQDDIESRSLYDLLEKEVVPQFYARGTDGLPRQWIGRMKNSMRTMGPVFNSNRMVQEYTEKFYMHGIQRFEHLTEDRLQACRTLIEWKRQMAQKWAGIRVTATQQCAESELTVGGELPVAASVFLGGIDPDFVTVQLVHGLVEADGRITSANSVPMKLVRSNADGSHRFIGGIPCLTTGRHGYSVRVLPRHPDMLDALDMGLVLWA